MPIKPSGLITTLFGVCGFFAQLLIARLNRVINQTVKLPDVRKRLISSGLEVLDSTTPEEYTAFRKADLAKWIKIIKDINLHLE